VSTHRVAAVRVVTGKEVVAAFMAGKMRQGAGKGKRRASGVSASADLAM
jgi:hypothetical protein